MKIYNYKTGELVGEVENHSPDHTRHMTDNEQGICRADDILTAGERKALGVAANLTIFTDLAN
jgi:hypothetical protein